MTMTESRAGGHRVRKVTVLDAKAKGETKPDALLSYLPGRARMSLSDNGDGALADGAKGRVLGSRTHRCTLLNMPSAYPTG